MWENHQFDSQSKQFKYKIQHITCLEILDTTHTHTHFLSLTHTNMAWKSVMSSTSHHALFLCSEVSEANGNSSFSPSPPTTTFILSCLPFLLTLTSLYFPHCEAALIRIEEAPHCHHPKNTPPFLPLHLNNLPASPPP